MAPVPRPPPPPPPFPGNFSSNWRAPIVHMDNEDLSFFSGESLLLLVKAAANVFYPLIMVIGVSGNLMVIVVIFKVKEMRNSTNIFLANLAVTDITVLLVWGALLSNSFLANQIRKGLDYEIMILWDFFRGTVINASVLTVLAIGYERYYAICQPLKAGYICTKSRAYRYCILAWVVAAASCSPRVLLNIFLETSFQELYSLTNISLFFCIPPVVLVVLFATIVRHLKKAVAQNVNTAAIKHHQQVISMLATVVCCFFVLQMPYRAFHFLIYWWEKEVDECLGINGFSVVSHLSNMLLYLHSAVNPVLYNLMSKRFRAGFRSICCSTT